MTTAGQLRERVSFQQRGADANGDPLGDWQDALMVWARVLRLKGSEPVMQQRLQGVQPVVISVRSSATTRGISTAWRAVDQRTGQIYDIKAVTPNETRSFIDFLAEETGLGGGV